ADGSGRVGTAVCRAGVGRRSVLAHRQAEVLRPGGGSTRRSANRAAADPGADVGVGGAQNVLAVAGARHPCVDDLQRGCEARRDVLSSIGPDETGCRDPGAEAGAVAELSARDHVISPALSGTVQAALLVQGGEM